MNGFGLRQRHPLPDARRADPERLAQDVRSIAQSPVVGALLESFDGSLLVLNAERQIVAFNGRGLVNAPEVVNGARPGEALGCVIARSAAGGCGTATACETCGALGAILRCQGTRQPAEAECLLSSSAAGGTSLELNVRATPIVVDERTFIVAALRDVSAEKRKDALEQIFFHDVLNSVAGLRGWAARLRRADADHARAGERIDVLSRQIEREILDHRTLVLAESGTLSPRLSVVPVADLLRDVELVFSSHAAAERRQLVVDWPSDDAAVETDPSLLVRVLVNMTRNALEASSDGGTVRIWAERRSRATSRGERADDALRLAVHNDAVMTPAIQARVFQRSFSTKAPRGRGLGTYSMKLLGERYLSGTVSFASRPGSGTVFWIELPARRSPAPPLATC